MAYFPFLGTYEEVRAYLKDQGLGLKERLKIQSQFRRKRAIEKNKEQILNLIEKLGEEKALKSPEKRHILFKEIQRVPILWWERLFSLLLAIEGKNHPWALELKRDLIKTSPYVYLIYGLPFSSKEQIIIRDFIITVLNRYKEEFEDTEGVRILAEKFTVSANNNDSKVIRNRLDADWSLTELRERFKNPLLRSEFFDFWYMVMMNRTAESEVRSRFRKALTERALKNSQSSQLWVMEYFFPAEKIKRDIILKRLKKMWQGPNALEQYTVLKVSGDRKVKNLLAKEVDDFKRAEFQIKREYFTSLLNSGFSTHFALSELYFLGDKDEDNLWWLIL